MVKSAYLHRVTGRLQCFRLISTHCTTEEYAVLLRWLTRVNLAQESRGILLVTFGTIFICAFAISVLSSSMRQLGARAMRPAKLLGEYRATLSQVLGSLQGLSSHSSFKHCNVKLSHAFFFTRCNSCLHSLGDLDKHVGVTVLNKRNKICLYPKCADQRTVVLLKQLTS